MDDEQTAPPVAPEIPRFSSLRGLFGNIAAGFRLALFMPVRREDFRADVNQAVYALMAMASASVLYKFLAALPSPTLNLFAVGNIAAGFLAMILGTWALAAVRRSTHAFSMFLIILATTYVTATAFIWGGIWVAQNIFSNGAVVNAVWVILGIGILWMGLLAHRAQRLVLDTRSWKNGGASLLYLFFLLAPTFALPQQQLWYQGHSADESAEAEAPHKPINVERAFYAQRTMLDEALAKIAPGRPDLADLYFVGFAGYGRQDVFMKEVKTAATLFDQRFDTAGRSLALINNRATIDDVPLANVSNLRLSLNGLAGRMNRDEDILFLFLTSHGSPGQLSTQFWPLQHNTLTPEDLRAALDDAGIRWRVIVVSACYSGSFIEALQTDETLVMTAARKDLTSFGCSNEAEFTYFGRALFNEALRETHSFVDAFGTASAAIAERETAEELTPSEPQIYIGATIRAKLAELEDRLRNAGDVAVRD